MDFLNSFVRNRGSRCWLSLGLFAAMFMLAVLISGCGSSGGHGSGGSSAQSFSDVIFRFKTMDSKVSARSLPDGTNTVRFTGSTSSREVLYGPVSKACAPQITLEEVSVKVTGFVLQYLSSDGALTGLYPVAVKMNLYGDTYVDIGDCPDLASVIADISVSPSSIGDLAIGYSESFTVTATLIDGQVVDLTPYITFTSSDESIATVSVNGVDGAKVTGQAGGTAVISGSVLGVTIPDLSVTVDPGVVETGVLISPDNFVLAPGTTRNANAFVQFSNGTTKALDSSVVTWSVEPASGLVELTPSDSGDSSCSLLGDSNAKEGDSGLLKINVKTEAGNTFEAQATITISNKLPKSLALTNDTVGTTRQGLEENQIWDSGEYSSTKCTATATYTDGSTADVTDQVIWASSNTTVADFDPASAGRLQGASEGTTSVTATLGDVASPGMDITVVSGTAADFKIETDQDPETGIVLLYNSELGSEQIPVAVSAWALYPNGEKVYLNTTNSAVEIVDTNGSVHTDLVNVTDDDKCVKLAAAKLSLDSVNLRFTYEGVQSDLIPVTIKDRAPEVTYFSLVDTTTNTRWPLESGPDNEIELPIGRAYYVDVQGVWNDGTKGDFSQYYAIWDGNATGDIAGEDGKPFAITITGTKVGDSVEQYRDWFLSGSASNVVTSRANVDGYVGQSIEVECKGIYRTVSEGQTMFKATITVGKPAIDLYVPLSIYRLGDLASEVYAFVTSDDIDGIDFTTLESRVPGSIIEDYTDEINELAEAAKEAAIAAGKTEEEAEAIAEQARTSMTAAAESEISKWANVLGRVSNGDDVVFDVARGTNWNVLGVG
ncbi:MAG: Ig-like domain-containing protein, partial [bacterium]|nr:Ig-like domain-containing protein [bacterium]